MGGLSATHRLLALQGYLFYCSGCTAQDTMQRGAVQDVHCQAGWLKALTLMYGFPHVIMVEENSIATTNEIIML